MTIVAEPEPSRGGRSRRRGARARRADRPLAAAPACTTRRVALPVLIHGDAAFAGPGRRRGDAQPAEPRGLLDRRHAPPDHEQPGRLHDRPDREPLDALLERPREGIRHPDRPRQRGRSRGGAVARSALALAYRAEFGHDVVDRHRRLSPLRPQRAGRAGVHAAADGRADQAAADGARAVRRAARRRGRRSRRARPTALVDRGDRRRCERPTSGCAASIAAPPSPPAEPVRPRGTGDAVETAVARRAAACARRAAACGTRGIHRQPEARTTSSSAGATRSRTAGSTGVTPRRSPSRRSSRTGSPSA